MTDKAEQFKAKNAGQDKEEMREVDGKKEYLDTVTNEWVGKNELKKRQTVRKKAAKDAEKAATKKAAPAKAKKEEGKGGAAEEELDPSKYRENRINQLENMRK